MSRLTEYKDAVFQIGVIEDPPDPPPGSGGPGTTPQNPSTPTPPPDGVQLISPNDPFSGVEVLPNGTVLNWTFYPYASTFGPPGWYVGNAPQSYANAPPGTAVPSGITLEAAKQLPGAQQWDTIGQTVIIHYNNGTQDTFQIDPQTGLLTNPSRRSSNPGPTAQVIAGNINVSLPPLETNVTGGGFSEEALFSGDGTTAQSSEGLRSLQGLDPLTRGQAVQQVLAQSRGSVPQNLNSLSIGQSATGNPFGSLSTTQSGALDPLQMSDAEKFARLVLQGRQSATSDPNSPFFGQGGFLESPNQQAIRLTGLQSTGDPLKDAALAAQIMDLRSQGLAGSQGTLAIQALIQAENLKKQLGITGQAPPPAQAAPPPVSPPSLPAPVPMANFTPNPAQNVNALSFGAPLGTFASIEGF